MATFLFPQTLAAIKSVAFQSEVVLKRGSPEKGKVAMFPYLWKKFGIESNFGRILEKNTCDLPWFVGDYCKKEGVRSRALGSQRLLRDLKIGFSVLKNCENPLTVDSLKIGENLVF